jgi:hypothetical protein
MRVLAWQGKLNVNVVQFGESLDSDGKLSQIRTVSLLEQVPAYAIHPCRQVSKAI